MAFTGNGTLKTDKREVAISETWDTQTEWEAYRSLSGIEITNGVLTLAEEQIPASAVSRWTFDTADTSGTTALDVWNGNDASNFNVTTGVSGIAATDSGEAYEFNGTDAYVDSTIDMTTIGFPFTLSVWVNALDASESNMIMSNRNDSGADGFQFMYNNSQLRFRFPGGDPNIQSSLTAQDDTTYHVVGVAEQGNFNLYVDGNLEGSSSTSTASIGPTNPMLIGQELNNTLWFDGVIDDPRVYDKALSATEVNNLYTTGSI